mgnify:CR=1 FL=1
MGANGRFGALIAYFRAAYWRSMGANLGSRGSIGAGCEATRLRAIRLGSRSVVEPHVIFKLVEAEAGLHGGEHVFIGRGTQFDLSGTLEIGDGTLIAPGCFITDHNHGTAGGQPIWKQSCEYRPVKLGCDVWLGAKVVVLPGVTIGDGGVVAAGAVVNREVPPMAMVAGVPAKLVRMRR